MTDTTLVSMVKFAERKIRREWYDDIFKIIHDLPDVICTDAIRDALFKVLDEAHNDVNPLGSTLLAISGVEYGDVNGPNRLTIKIHDRLGSITPTLGTIPRFIELPEDQPEDPVYLCLDIHFTQPHERALFEERKDELKQPKHKLELQGLMNYCLTFAKDVSDDQPKFPASTMGVLGLYRSLLESHILVKSNNLPGQPADKIFTATFYSADVTVDFSVDYQVSMTCWDDYCNRYDEARAKYDHRQQKLS
jgi:hypothetical protein